MLSVKEFNDNFDNKKQNYLVNAANKKGSIFQKTLEAYQNEYNHFIWKNYLAEKMLFILGMMKI